MIDSDTVILFTRNGMGHAVPELQLKLAGTYLKLLDELNILPGAICSTPKVFTWQRRAHRFWSHCNHWSVKVCA